MEYLRSRRTSSGLSRKESQATFVEQYNAGVSYPKLYAALGDVAQKTLDKWCRALERSGYDMTVLAEKYGQHRRGRRIVSKDEMDAMLKYGLHPNRLRISQVIRWAKKDLEQQGLPSTASEATMRRALIDWRSSHYDKWVFAREGEKALAEKALPYLERDISALGVGDVLVADGHPLNFQVINPFTGRPGRATLLMFFDWASRFPAGWYLMFSENTQTIHAALRRAIRALGKMPRAVYLDNGKAFRAKVFTDKVDFEQAGIRGLYARLGIETHFARPYNAKAKVVERFFGTFNELERLVPSYTGAFIADKPAHLLRNERLHKNLHNPHVPTIQEAQQIIRAWAWDEYANRPHAGLKGQKPGDVWAAGKGPGVDEEQLRDLMMTEEIKHVHRNGITLFGQHYYDDALYGYRSPVLVRYDILDMAYIHVYSADGTKYLCTALPVSMVHPLAAQGTKLDREILRQKLADQKRLKKETESSWRTAAKRVPWLTMTDATPAEMTSALQSDLTPAEIEHIEAEAAKVEVIHLEPEQPQGVRFLNEDEAYEYHLKARLAGEQLTGAQLNLMTEYEQTKQYQMLKPYYDRIIAQHEEACRVAQLH
jgi:putative transposase